MYVLSSPVSIPYVTACTVSLSDVRVDVSGTGHPIVICGVKRFHLPECSASMRADMYSGDTISHSFTLDCEVADILRYRVKPTLDSV